MRNVQNSTKMPFSWLWPNIYVLSENKTCCFTDGFLKYKASVSEKKQWEEVWLVEKRSGWAPPFCISVHQAYKHTERRKAPFPGINVFANYFALLFTMEKNIHKGEKHHFRWIYPQSHSLHVICDWVSTGRDQSKKTPCICDDCICCHIHRLHNFYLVAVCLYVCLCTEEQTKKDS